MKASRKKCDLEWVQVRREDTGQNGWNWGGCGKKGVVHEVN